MKRTFLATTTLVLASMSPSTWAGFPDELGNIQHQWAVVNYETPESEQEHAFDQLTAEALRLHDANPEKAEALVWLAIVLSSDAGATGGISALGKVKDARTYLEQAEKIDATVLDGSVYTSLGSLYYKVPGWPIGFGDNEKADTYLRKALEINPDGIDPNYFYGDFMLEEGRPEEAVRYLEKAQSAPPRPDRPLSDTGRQREIAAKLQQARSEL